MNFDELKERYKKVKEDYAILFCKRMGLDYEDSYFTGNVFSVADYFVDFTTIVFAVDNMISETTFFEWYDYNLFLGEAELGDISLEQYCNGRMKYSVEDINKLREAKNQVIDAKRHFETLLLQTKNKYENN